jgi:hypothetical protein
MRRRRKAAGLHIPPALRAFEDVLIHVEEARATLLLGVPSGRGARVPMAQALAGFEGELGAARTNMDGWRLPAVEAAWQVCTVALEASAQRAERLRLQGPTEAYEHLVPLLDELLEPLDAFAEEAEAVRRALD